MHWTLKFVTRGFISFLESIISWWAADPMRPLCPPEEFCWLSKSASLDFVVRLHCSWSGLPKHGNNS